MFAIINTVIEKRFQEKEIENEFVHEKIVMHIKGLIEIKDNDRYELDWKIHRIECTDCAEDRNCKIIGSSLVERLFLKGTVYRDGSDFTS
ncbi:hypothetical protein RIR_jg41440.t2 [Rhizophagus irregularis DAOM 181602=DAOM 197198]|nr:hypothetical protein RIR_jg41440.t2 [Rhizophagus irregularis DAOM 181602=DAOM 197198]